MGINIETNMPLVRDRAGRFVTHVPKVSEEQAEHIAKIFAEKLSAGSPPWPESSSSLTIKKSLKVVKTERGYGVTLVEHGFFVNAMKTHAAPSGFGETENPVMKSWLEQYRPGYELPWIWVKKKPWITKSLQEGTAVMREYVKSGKTELSKFLKSLGG